MATKTKTLKELEKYEKGYTTSKTVTSLLNELNALQKPKYSNEHEKTVNELMHKILNREAFTYDINGDVLYNQFKNQYQNLGKLAMTDTMGQAAALTGGYGNSYASTAGNQAYQSYLTELNNVIPALYEAAYSRYNQEGDRMLQNYGIAKNQYDTKYNQYQDALGQYNTDRSYLSDRYSNERGFDYGQYSDNKSYWYGKSTDEQSQANYLAQQAEAKRQYEQQLAYQKARDAVEDKQWQKEYELTLKKNNTGTENIPSYVTKKLETFTNNDELANYLDTLEKTGTISAKQADSLYATYLINTVNRNKETRITGLPPAR